MNNLLIEPDYYAKYPPLGLMKISSYLKNKLQHVDYRKGICNNLEYQRYDKVYISSLFTYDFDTVLKTIEFYKSKCINAEIVVGGIAATLIPNKISNIVNLKIIKSLWLDVEFTPPDYDLFSTHPWGDHSFVFTTRGCPNNCSFCAVQKLEPDRIINHRWKEHISPNHSSIMIHDNNLTSFDINHFSTVMEHLKILSKPVTFDNGFDCKLFTEEHCKLLSKINIRTIRFAFDSLSQDGYIQKAIRLCNKFGISSKKILVYVLYNFNDNINEALYRAKEITKLGARPYAMRYTPLLSVKKDFCAHGWDNTMCVDFFEFVNNRKLVGIVDFFEWQKRWKKRR